MRSNDSTDRSTPADASTLNALADDLDKLTLVAGTLQSTAGMCGNHECADTLDSLARGVGKRVELMRARLATCAPSAY